MNVLKTFFATRWHVFVFALLLAFLCWQSGAFRLLHFRPLGEHAWAQIDRAAIAYNYYTGDASFFLPKTQSVVYNSTAIAPGEFPLMPYLAALLYKIFGFNESWFRLLTFVCSISGLFLALALAQRLIRDRYLALSTALLWMSSSYLLYYTTNFLPDSVSLACLIAAFYVLLRRYPDIPPRAWIGFAIFGALALLLKTSAFFLYAPSVFFLLWHTWRKAGTVKALGRPLLFSAIPAGAMGAWLLYAHHLQDKYHSNVFVLGTKAPAAFSDYRAALDRFFEHFGGYYDSSILIAAAAGMLLLIVFRKKAPLLLNLTWISCLAAWLVFFYGMCRNADHHSYYHVTFFFLFFVFFLAVFITIRRMELSSGARAGILGAIIVLFVYNTFQVKSTFDKVAYTPYLIEPAWYGAPQQLEAMGIKPSDKLFSCDDPSPNISLYLMQHRGWNAMKDYWSDYLIPALKDCDYAVLTDTSIVQKPDLKMYFGEKVGAIKNLQVYRIRH